MRHFYSNILQGAYCGQLTENFMSAYAEIAEDTCKNCINATIMPDCTCGDDILQFSTAKQVYFCAECNKIYTINDAHELDKGQKLAAKIKEILDWNSPECFEDFEYFAKKAEIDGKTAREAWEKLA